MSAVVIKDALKEWHKDAWKEEMDGAGVAAEQENWGRIIWVKTDGGREEGEMEGARER